MKCNEDAFYCTAAVAGPPVAEKRISATSFKSISHYCVKTSFDIQELSMI